MTLRAAAISLLIAIAIAAGSGAAAFTHPARAKPLKGPTVVIGTKNFPEELILGELYKQALQAKGFRVLYRESIGPTEVIHRSLTRGRINFYPEYTGILVQDVFHKRSPRTANATYELARRLEAAEGFSLLDATPFSNTDVVVVTNATAKRYGLKSIGDLKRVGPLTFGAFPECKLRSTCLAGYRKAYGLTRVSFVPLSGTSVYAALDTGAIDAGDGFSTDPLLGDGSRYTVLADPKHVTGFQNVVPIVKTSVLEAAGAPFSKIVNDVSSKLTLTAIVGMNSAVILNKQDPARVASAFLKANGLE